MAYVNGKRIMGVVNVVGEGGSDGVNLTNYYTKKEIDDNFIKNEGSSKRDLVLNKDSINLNAVGTSGSSMFYYSPYTFYMGWYDNYNNRTSIQNQMDGVLKLDGSKDIILNEKSFNDLYDKVQQLSGDYNLIRPSTGTTYTRTIDNTVEKYIYISEVGGMSYKSENLFNSNYELGNINLDTGAVEENNYMSRTNDYIKVSSSTTYSYRDIRNINNANYATITYVYEYDKDKNFIQQKLYQKTVNDNIYFTTFTTQATTQYIKIAAVANYKAEYIPTQATLVKGTYTASTLGYIEYFGGIRHTPVSDIKLNGSSVINLNEVCRMEGYGYGIDENCYNYLDFDKDVLVRKVGSYTFNGLESFTQTSTAVTGKNRYWFTAIAVLVKKSTASNVKGNILFEDLETQNADTLYLAQKDGIAIEASSGNITFFINDIQNVNDLKNYLKGKTIYYELAEPIENALPQINTFIEAKHGDVITFENQYQKGVPSTIKYIRVV